MTAPDPGLTDLIAAALYSVLAKAAKSGTATVDDLVASVIPVVEQHTNGRIAEANVRARARVKAANKRASIRITQIRKEEAARFEAEARAEKAEAGRSQIKEALWTITSQLDSQAEYLGTGDDGTEWINYARNKIQKAYVECGLHLELDVGRAALEGEQQ